MTMIVTKKPFVPPDYDPYEEDCVGSHDGEEIRIDCGKGLTLIVRETRSGIGPNYKAWFESCSPKTGLLRGRSGELYAFIDDDNKFVHGFRLEPYDNIY